LAEIGRKRSCPTPVKSIIKRFQRGGATKLVVASRSVEFYLKGRNASRGFTVLRFTVITYCAYPKDCVSSFLLLSLSNGFFLPGKPPEDGISLALRDYKQGSLWRYFVVQY
jgi:hypothetical protein